LPWNIGHSPEFKLGIWRDIELRPSDEFWFRVLLYGDVSETENRCCTHRLGWFARFHGLEQCRDAPSNLGTIPLSWSNLILGIFGPAILAYLIGSFVFGGRVTGVFVAIITLAALVVVNLIVIDQQFVTGGFNGITDLAFLNIFGYEFDAYGTSSFYLAFAGLVVSLLVANWFINSRTGLITQAIRDDENRVRYLGYNVSMYQCLVMGLSAAIAGLGGMIYTVVMEFASPTFLDVKISLAVVIWCAVGGRQSFVGCFWGAVLINGVQGSLSETELFLETWTLLMGLLFILVVLFLPRGLAGLSEILFRKFRTNKSTQSGGLNS